MVENTYNKVINFIDLHHMIEDGDLIVTGVSGGADSVCLLHLLWRLSRERSFRLIAVHVDHGVRAESAEDAAYVEQLCNTLKIPLHIHTVDMNSYAAEHKLSSEEAGRQLRYAAFEEVLGQHRGTGCGRIAVAHNANDRAETMLFHLFRGSGMKGLASIRPVRGLVIRPLLCLEREEIERYLAEHHLEYCQDSTNGEDKYTRNRIRHHILPYAEQEVCSGAVEHMGELADILSETEDYLERQTMQLYRTYVEEIHLPELPAGVVPDVETLCLCVRCKRLLSEDPAMYKRVLLACMEYLTPHRKDVTGQHIADLTELMSKNGNRQLSLPNGIKAYKEYDRLILYRSGTGVADRNHDEEAKEAYMIEPPAKICVPDDVTYTFTLIENNADCDVKQQNIQENRYTKWFDYDKITTTLMLRTRQQGDYLTIDTALHTKSVKQYMINEKIPKRQRDSMYILADGPHILWIPGYRISERYKVDQSTRRILEVRLRGGNHGGTS